MGVSNAEAHIHLGIGAFLVFALLLRRHPRGLFLAWLGVFALQTANEIMDAIDWLGWMGEVNWTDSAVDYVRTMIWPTVLVWLMPRFRQL